MKKLSFLLIIIFLMGLLVSCTDKISGSSSNTTNIDPQGNPEDSNPQGQNPSTPVEDEQVKANRLFKEDVQNRIKNNANADLNDLSLEGITSLEGLFKGNKDFNGNISKWDVSKIENFGAMFKDSTFNGDISRWNVSKGKNFKSMFENSGFNGNISDWKPKAAKNMQFMFKNNTAFNQNLSSWIIDESKTLFASIFKGATKMLGTMDAARNSPEGTANMPKTIKARYDKMVKPLDETSIALKTLMSNEITKNGNDGDYNYIDTSDTNSFDNLFYPEFQSFNGKINDWDTRKVTNLSYMFAHNNYFNNSISDWDTSNVTNMLYVFAQTKSFNSDISKWNTSKVDDMGSMFYKAEAFNQPLNNWDTSNLTSLNFTFFKALKFNQELSNWDTSKVTKMNALFSGASDFNKPIGSWNTLNVISMEGMFLNASKFNQDIKNWDVSKVENIEHMFANAVAFNQDLTSWNKNLTNEVLLNKLKNIEYKNSIFKDSTAMEDKNKPTILK